MILTILTLVTQLNAALKVNEIRRVMHFDQYLGTIATLEFTADPECEYFLILGNDIYTGFSSPSTGIRKDIVCDDVNANPLHCFYPAQSKNSRFRIACSKSCAVPPTYNTCTITGQYVWETDIQCISFPGGQGCPCHMLAAPANCVYP